MALTLPLAELQFPARLHFARKNGWEFSFRRRGMVRRAEAEEKPPFIYNKVRPSELALKNRNPDAGSGDSGGAFRFGRPAGFDKR